MGSPLDGDGEDGRAQVTLDLREDVGQLCRTPHRPHPCPPAAALEGLPVPAGEQPRQAPRDSPALSSLTRREGGSLGRQTSVHVKKSGGGTEGAQSASV